MKSLTVGAVGSSDFILSALNSTNASMHKQMHSLATGLRVNSAADDAAAASIIEKLSAESRGSSRALANIGDAMSMIDTTDSALAAVGDDLQRIRELTVQANNGTFGQTELDAIQSEINARVTNIQDMTNSAEFNDISLLSGGGDINIQAGSDTGDTSSIPLSAVNTDVNSIAAGSLGEGSSFDLASLNVGGSLASVSGNTVQTSAALDGLDSMVNNVSTMRSSLGATSNALESKYSNLEAYSVNLASSISIIRDADIASFVTGLAQSSTLQGLSTRLISQSQAIDRTVIGSFFNV